jgi:hypothetical protein
MDGKGVRIAAFERTAMSSVGSVGSSVSVQQLDAMRAQAKAAAATSKSAEEQAESPSQEAAEHDGGGLDVTA